MNNLKRPMIVILIACVLLFVLGYGVIQRFAEPIDRAGCKADCRLEGMDFARYEYLSNTCWCMDSQGQEVELYRTFDLE